MKIILLILLALCSPAILANPQIENNKQLPFFQIELEALLNKNQRLLEYSKNDQFKNHLLQNKSLFSDSLMADLELLESHIKNPIKTDSSPIFHRTDRISAKDKATLEALITSAITTLFGFHGDLDEKSTFINQLKFINEDLSQALEITKYTFKKDKVKKK